MKKPLGLYLHIPFCKQKCLYCGFLSKVPAENEIDYYVKYIKKEILLFKNKWNSKDIAAIRDGYIVDSIFFGGGTPSLLEKHHVEIIIETIKEVFDVSKHCEITIEANPESTTKEKLKDFKKSGINRLSIGLQNDNNEMLRAIGRIHNIEDFERCYFNALDLGYNNINIDLIMGLPGQTKEKSYETINHIISYNPQHISMYTLQIEENTPLYDLYKYNNIQLPNDREEREIYQGCSSILKSNGYKHYEISNFAKSQYESKHNLKYWNMNDFIGFGLGSSSYFEKRRFNNTNQYKKYYEALDKDILPNEELLEGFNNTNHDDDNLSLKNYLAEESLDNSLGIYCFTALRKMTGIVFEDFEKYFGHKMSYYYDLNSKELMNYCNDGLLIIDNVGIRLTETGIDKSNEIMSCFIL